MQNPFDIILEELVEIKAAIFSMRDATAKHPIEIIGRDELLKRLAISEPTAIAWGKRGKIPEIRFGSNVRYNWPSVVDALESGATKGAVVTALDHIPDTTHIIDCDFSVRVFNLLFHVDAVKAARIQPCHWAEVPISVFSGVSEADLYSIKGFGKSCMNELKRVLASANIQLKK